MLIGQLGNMVAESSPGSGVFPELCDEDDYLDLKDDIREELEKFGTVRAVVIPRPAGAGAPPVPGLGKVSECLQLWLVPCLCVSA